MPLLALPAIPTEWDTTVNVNGLIVGGFCTVQRKVETAGTAFFERFEAPSVALLSSATSSADSTSHKGEDEAVSSESRSPSSDKARLGSSEEAVSSENPSLKQTQSKTSVMKNACVHNKVRKALNPEKPLDLFKILGLKEGSRIEDIRRNYRKLVLVFHPDKKHSSAGLPRSASEDDLRDLLNGYPWDPKKMSLEQMKLHFVNIQEAFEILSEPLLARQYVCGLSFDESLPGEKDVASGDDEIFYRIVGAAFAKESRWSEKQPVPELGDDSTPLEDVKRFYQFWATFESNRDFSHKAEHDLGEADCKEERRWIQKENWKIVSKAIKAEHARIRKFVSWAEGRDPRLRREKEEAKRLREEAKRLVEEAKAAEEARILAEAEAARLKAENEKKEAAEKKKEAKKVVAEIRRNIRALYRDHCLAFASEFDCPFTAEGLQEYLVAASLEELQQMFATLKEIAENENQSSSVELGMKIAQYCHETIGPFWEAKNPYRKYEAKVITRKVENENEKPKEGAALRDHNSNQQHLKEWTPEQLSLLAKAVVKYPGGHQNRWEKIAEFINAGFTPQEVIAQSKKLKESSTLVDMGTKISEQAFNLMQKKIPEENKQIAAPLDLRGGESSGGVNGTWSKAQQKALEGALQKYPNQLPAKERWNLIATQVPEKDAKECLARFKEIREIIRRNKQQQG